MRLRFYIILFFLANQLAVSGQEMDRILKSKLADEIKADSIDLLARKYMLKGKRDSARIFLVKALELAKQSGNNIIIARCYVDFGNLYSLQANYTTALQYVQLAWPYLAVIDHYDIRISGMLLLANIYNFSGKKDSALYYFREAEEYNAAKFPYRNWVVYIAMSELFNQTDDLAGAEKYLLKAYNLTFRKENKPDHGYVLTLFINLYIGRNNPGSAGRLFAEYNELMEERKKNNFVDPLHSVLMNLTSSKLENNLDFMTAVKESSLKEGQFNQAMIANGYIIRYYEKKRNFEKALAVAAESEDLAAKTGNVFMIYGIKKIKYGIFQKAGKNAEAVSLADSLFILKDSMLAQQKRDQLYDLEGKYESEKKQKEIQLLASQNEVSEKTIVLLTTDKQLSVFQLLSRENEKKALEVENRLMDSIVKSKQAYNDLLQMENDFKTAKLNKEKELMQSLTRENILKGRQVKKERQTKWLLAAGAALVLVSGLSIFSLYRRQKQKNQIIQQQSNDLEVLMKEIHHRVKNNLQVISSLLDLQSMTITNIQASEAVKEGKNRVQSMALIHQNLYSEGNIKGIKTKEYIINLLQSLCDSYNITNDKVKVKTEIDDLNLDVDTMIPLGLVINELVSNSLKYAFKTGQPGELSIILKEEPLYLLLKVSDNGTGYPEGMNAKDSKSFGMKMIRAFAQKLKAKLDIYNSNGAVVEMKITKYNLA